MDFIKEIDDNTLIICNNTLKEKILIEISKINKLFNIKIMSIKEFYNNFFFSYDERVIFYVKEKLNVTREIADIYLSNLKYIINSNIDDPKISFLKDLLIDLENNKLLKYNYLFKNYLNNVKILLIDIDIDNFTFNILNNYNIKIINTDEFKRECNYVYHFNNIEDEVEYVFNKISLLIKNNISRKNIKLIYLGQEYESIIKRFSNLYNIKFNNLDNYSIYSTVDTIKFLNLIKSNTKKDEIYSYIKPNLDKDIYNCYLNIINKYYFIDDLNDVIDFIIYDLKNTYLKEDRNIDAINIIDLNSNLVSDSDHVFILGFNQENVPKTYKDIDYLEDNLKEKLGISTSFEKNKIERKSIIKNINNIKNITISYKDNSPYNSYYPSNLISDLNLTIKEDFIINTTSNLYNKIKLTNYLDLMIRYGIKDNNLTKLYNTYYNIPYLTYNNKFNGISNFTLNNITLSYTSLNNYYHCGFRYYIDSILKLNIYEESFKQFIGTMFHDILKKMYNSDFDFEFEWNNYLKDKDFSKKELFYLRDLKIELKNIIKVLNYQYQLTGLTNLKLEERVTINFNNNCNFTGIIDKIMFKERDNNTYISIIDYKTGIPKINMANLKYGIDTQLPIYVYLTLKSNLFDNPKIVGFYLEQILHEKSSSNNKDIDANVLDNLKLIGYSIDDPYLISIFDSSYENSEMIKGMKITSKGFAHYTKVLSNDAINKLANMVEEKIKECFNLILKGDFSINPKVINGENIGCSFCKYQDLCFKTGKDLVYLKGESDLSFLEE